MLELLANLQKELFSKLELSLTFYRISDNSINIIFLNNDLYYSGKDISYTLSFRYFFFDFTVYVVKAKDKFLYFVFIKDNNAQGTYICFENLIDLLEYKIKLIKESFTDYYKKYQTCEKDLDTINHYKDNL